MTSSYHALFFILMCVFLSLNILFMIGSIFLTLHYEKTERKKQNLERSPVRESVRSENPRSSLVPQAIIYNAIVESRRSTLSASGAPENI